jgi:hypothetical protein
MRPHGGENIPDFAASTALFNTSTMSEYEPCTLLIALWKNETGTEE